MDFEVLVSEEEINQAVSKLYREDKNLFYQLAAPYLYLYNDNNKFAFREDLIKAAIKYDKFLGGTGLYKGSSYYPSRVFNWNENQRHYYMSTIRRNVVNNAKIKRISLLSVNLCI